MSAPKTLSAKLRIAQGRPPEDLVVIPEILDTRPDGRREGGGIQARCASSVMPGQHCRHAAIVGSTLCASHLAMLDTR